MEPQIFQQLQMSLQRQENLRANHGLQTAMLLLTAAKRLHKLQQAAPHSLLSHMAAGRRILYILLRDAGCSASQAHPCTFCHEGQRGTKGSSAFWVPGLTRAATCPKRNDNWLPLPHPLPDLCLQAWNTPLRTKPCPTPQTSPMSAVLGSSTALQKQRAKKCTHDGFLITVWRSVTKQWPWLGSAASWELARAESSVAVARGVNLHLPAGVSSR